MKRYKRSNPTGPKKHTVLFRVLFVILAAAAITFGTVFTGNALLKKVQNAEAAPVVSEGTGIQFERPEGEDRSVGSAPSVRGASLSLLAFDTEEAVTRAIGSLSEVYNAVVFPLCDTDGKLIYQSPAVCALVRMQPTESEMLDLFKTAIRTARERGLRVMASLVPAESTADAALMGELASFGVNEILLTPPLTNTPDYETANRLRLYLNDCTAAVDPSCRLGVVLPAAAFLDSEGAMQLQMIAQTASSLAIRFDYAGLSNPDDLYEAVSDAIQSLMGTFSVYNMRVAIEETNTYRISAVYQACADRGITNYFFTNYINLDSMEYVPPEELQPVEPAEYEPEENPEPAENPYANTKDSYAEETEALPEEPVPEPEPVWEPISEPAAEPGSDAGTDPGTSTWTDPGTSAWTDPGTSAWTDPGTAVGSGDDWFDPNGAAEWQQSGNAAGTGTPPAEFIDEYGNWTGWMDAEGNWHPNGGW